MSGKILHSNNRPIKHDVASHRVASVTNWIKKIDTSSLSSKDYFKKYKVPFSRSQYYIYKKKIQQLGINGIQDKRHDGGNRKVSKEIEAYVSGLTVSDSTISPGRIRDQIQKKYGILLSTSGITRLLKRVCPDRKPLARGRPIIKVPTADHHPYGGFELIVALAYHLGWPQMVTNAIRDVLEAFKQSSTYAQSTRYCDMEGRSKRGRFTVGYNKRKDIRENRFASISQKRSMKNWQGLNIFRDQSKIIERKTMAILSLPVVTMNGAIRSVNTAIGQNLRNCAGFDYKQNSLTKYLNELKYVGVSTELLSRITEFWHRCWGGNISNNVGQRSLLCYYVDGNTKPLWSSKHVKKNKVTMLGRVMGCLEHVFIHDCFGHPVYFETYSGHGCCGEHILGLFDKIEDVVTQIPHSSGTRVNRVIVMDGANNSVGTLRAFATQHMYHYITSLDDNQWADRRIVQRGRKSRYQYGAATLQNFVIELEDSREKGYMVRTGAVKIDWDKGKSTVLITSLPIQIVGASEIVHSYFLRWPAQELEFRNMKAAVGIHHVAGYGKQQIDDNEILKRQQYLLERINYFEALLKEPLEQISVQETHISKLVPKERKLKKMSTLKDGKRTLRKDLMRDLEAYSKCIRTHEREIKIIEAQYIKEFRLLRKHKKEWLRLQGKERIFKVDIELDQIMTFHRVSLANLYAYFIKHFMGGHTMSLKTLLYSIIHLPAQIIETKDSREVMIHYNKKDKAMMDKLSDAMAKLNNLHIIGQNNKKVKFSFI